MGIGKITRVKDGLGGVVMVSQARLGEWRGGVAYIDGKWNLRRRASASCTLGQIRGARIQLYVAVQE